MRKCKYCGQNAGFFHSKHAECEQRHLNGVARIKGILSNCVQHKEDFYLHQNEIQTLCRDAFVSDDICRNIYCESLVLLQCYFQSKVNVYVKRS